MTLMGTVPFSRLRKHQRNHIGLSAPQGVRKLSMSWSQNQRRLHTTHETHGKPYHWTRKTTIRLVLETSTPQGHQMLEYSTYTYRAHLLTHAGIFLALTWPGFFLSTLLGSRVTHPALRNAGFSNGSWASNAFPTAKVKASA